jgi:hypothetical protein
MKARNNFQGSAVQRQSEASRREIILSFASVFVVSAFIYAVTYFVVRLPA